MASEADIEALLQEGEQTLAAIQEFAAQGIPDTLADGVEKGIDLALKAGEAAILIRYDGEERRADRQRVIRLDHALQLLSDFEEEYLQATVTGQLRVLWGFFAAPIVAVWNALLGLWSAIQSLQVDAVRAALAKLWVTILRHLLDIAAMAEVVGPLREVLAMRKKYDALLRGKALKQRTVKRVWRRKRTRG